MLKLPEGWDVATAMDKDDKGYVAPTGYDEFIDDPIQMGTFVSKEVHRRRNPVRGDFRRQVGKDRMRPGPRGRTAPTG